MKEEMDKQKSTINELTVHVEQLKADLEKMSEERQSLEKKVAL